MILLFYLSTYLSSIIITEGMADPRNDEVVSSEDELSQDPHG